MKPRFNETLIKLTLLEVFSSLAKKYHLNPSKMKINYSFDGTSKVPSIEIDTKENTIKIVYEEFTNRPMQDDSDELRYLKAVFRLTYLKLMIGSRSLKKEFNKVTFKIRLGSRGLRPLVDIFINGRKVSKILVNELFRKAREEKLLTYNLN